MTAGGADQYKKGDEVFVFYRMDKRCSSTRKYVAVLDARQGAYRPRSGMADGWVPARVTADQRDDGMVEIEYLWPHFYTKTGRIAAAQEGWTEAFTLNEVRRAVGGPADGSQLLLPNSEPELAIIAFRWGGLVNISHSEQWGHTGTSASDTFFEKFLDHVVKSKVGTNYEVWTVYIEDHSDMSKIADMAHIMFGAQHPSRRAKRTCGMYFLYPTAFQEGCIPTMETGCDKGAALIEQKSFWNMQRAVERAGIPSRFPHYSHLYEQFASKRWTAQLTLTPHLRVPPTVAVPRMLTEHNASDAAAKAKKALEAVKRKQAVLRGEDPSKVTIEKGVAKLSFSWEALDVKYWEKEDGLKTALFQLGQVIEISDELTAQPHDCEAILVQEYIPHDLELRIYTVNGQVGGCIYTKFLSIKDNKEFGEFKQKFDQQEAADSWFDGDLKSLQDGERQCRELTQHWLDWIEAQSCETPAAVRFDFFIKRTDTPGKSAVWTLEICELGFSMLGHKELPDKVFGAMLDKCLEDQPGPAGCAVMVPEPRSKRQKHV
eukprot:TRINITY_DN6092_c0_g1_i3.p1 TRINITY_DN6092_c0_g1~~TRINITY_DN6092_c0_g1_i3.p1  ORF type:complete len:544 (-),score=130.05 TRINITY_DN6092_c0_g1_i3:61-1692(-)